MRLLGEAAVVENWPKESGGVWAGSYLEHWPVSGPRQRLVDDLSQT